MTTPAGWYPDPNDASGQRYWDGAQWTPHTAPGAVQPPAAAVTPTPTPAMTYAPAASNGGGPVGWIKDHKVWTAVIAVVVIAIIGGAAGAGGSDNTPTSNTTIGTTPSAATKTPPPQPPAPPSTPVGRARQALGDKVSSPVAVGDSTVRSVAVDGRILTVTLTTPEGGFQGPSTNDADGLSSVAFAKVYRAGWRGSTVVRFVGGLQSRATGKPLANALAFVYFISKRRAEQITWSNEGQVESIDWSVYRTLCHPAFKGCT